VNVKKKIPENRLLQMSELIGWAPIINHFDEMYKNKTEKSELPNFDFIVILENLIQ